MARVKLHGLGLNVVKPNRLFGVSGVSWQSCLVGHTRPSLLTPLSLNTAPGRNLLLLLPRRVHARNLTRKCTETRHRLLTQLTPNVETYRLKRLTQWRPG